MHLPWDLGKYKLCDNTLNDELYSRFVYGSMYSLQIELKGQFEGFPVYGRSRIMDLVTWHGDPTYFLFFYKKPDARGL
jgi:hypothetical protein